jgi:membrane fusion protein
MRPLFRLAAVHAAQDGRLGDIVLIRPLSFSLACTLAIALTGLFVALMAAGTYTRRSTVSGQLIPDTGIIKVYVPQPGIVLEKHVSEGSAVKQGDVLYVLSSERRSSTRGDTQAAISQQVHERELSLRDELGKTRQLQLRERDALAKNIGGLESELVKLEGQISGQRDRVRLSEEAMARHKKLLAEGFISREALQPKQADLMDQQARLQGLERERMAIGRDLLALRNDLAGLQFKQENQLARISRGIASAEQELSESEAKRRLIIAAPDGGTATVVTAEVGQAVEVGRPLVAIVPSGAKLQAHLHVPSRAVGFVRPGDAVLLRYQAYPYQKFGHQRGRVASVSRTATPSSEMSASAAPPTGPAAAANEPMYRITVDLESQAVGAYGLQQPLQAGMLLDADVLQDTRRLYEWALEPLYAVSGRL